MSRRNIFGVYDLEDPAFNLRAFRLHLLRLRLDTLYFRIQFCYSQLQVFYVYIVCHLIALRHWILTGEIMEAYLELLEELKDDE